MIKQNDEKIKIKEENVIEVGTSIEEEKKIVSTEVTISIAGDCTLRNRYKFCICRKPSK